MTEWICLTRRDGGPLHLPRDGFAFSEFRTDGCDVFVAGFRFEVRETEAEIMALLDIRS